MLRHTAKLQAVEAKDMKKHYDGQCLHGNQAVAKVAGAIGVMASYSEQLIKPACATKHAPLSCTAVGRGLVQANQPIGHRGLLRRASALQSVLLFCFRTPHHTNV